MSKIDSIALVWFGAFSLLTFIAFGFDKWSAGRVRARIPESNLVLLGAFGGWVAGLLAMYLFRHKTIKRSFQFKYALGLIPFAAEMWLYFRWR